MKDKKLIYEELNRMKMIMGYDSSKTLTENENKKQLNESGTQYWVVGNKLLSGEAIPGLVPKGASSLPGLYPSLKSATEAFKIYKKAGGGDAGKTAVKALSLGGTTLSVGSSLVGGGGTAAAAGGGTAAATTGTFLGLGPVGWTILGVIGLAALGTWAYTKDKDIEKVRTLFNMCVYHQDREKWKKYLSSAEVEQKADTLFKAMDEKLYGFIPQTDEEAVYGVMKSFKSPGDFCAVSKKYEQKYENSLLEDLDGDFDYGWDEIANPIVKMTEEYAKQQAKEFCNSNEEECAKKIVEACKKDPKLPNCETYLGDSNDVVEISDDETSDNETSNTETSDDEEKNQVKTDNTGKEYTVVQGDNLYKIARENNINLINLLKLNPDIIDPSEIEVGQVIKLG